MIGYGLLASKILNIKIPSLGIYGILQCFKISKGSKICLLDGDDSFTKKK